MNDGVFATMQSACFCRIPLPAQRRILSFLCVVFLTISCLTANAQQPDSRLTDEDLGITPATRQAIARGLDYLAGRQREDGSFVGSRGANTGIVSFAILSFMATGQMPDRGPRGEAITRSINFVLHQIQPSGLISNPDDDSNGVMYEHGMSVLMMAELAGDHDDPDLMRGLHRGVELIVHAQNDLGGWRYQPGAKDADISVTAMQIVALRAARDAGITVPRRTLDAAIGYVKRCATPEGGFLYQIGRGQAAYSRTAAGVCALLLGGQWASPEVLRGIRYLQAHKSPKQRGPIYPFYGLYYASHAMYLAPDPREWQQWYPPIRDELLHAQTRDGHWDGEAGPLYGTEMAILTLSIPMRYLPVYQR